MYISIISVYTLYLYTKKYRRKSSKVRHFQRFPHILSSILDARYIALCFLLIIGLNGKPTSAGFRSYLCRFFTTVMYVWCHNYASLISTNSFFSPSWYFFFNVVLDIYDSLMAILVWSKSSEIIYWCGWLFFAETCWEFPKVHPFCLKPMCKGNCYLEAKSQGVNLGGYHCDGNGFWGMCVYWFCKH
jgi:hypothetical protein